MTTPSESGSRPACNSRWLLPVLLALVLAAILLSQSRGIRQAIFRQTAPAARAGAGQGGESSQQVLVTINFGNGRLENLSTEWRDGMTVADILQQEPRISFKTEGAGEKAFLTTLGGVANEGGGGRNWTYSV